MTLTELHTITSVDDIGDEMRQFMARLYPICRSITGEGLRSTLRLIGEHIPLTIHEVPTGTQVYDWTVPKEWNIRDAYVKNGNGERVIDFRESNLHVMSYSLPVNKRIPLGQLKRHLFSLPEYPDWIPYRTSYYTENWGFCLSHNQLTQLKNEEYEVCIEASLEDGSMSYGEYCIRGDTSDEILISCHACHPSLCNDNLSGVVLATFLAKHLSRSSPRYTYRFLFIPATIGAIAWLCLNEARASKIKHGLVLACVGDRGQLTYKRSRRGDAEIDRAAVHVLKHSGAEYDVIDFFPYGYDERQFCSPGFNLPVGCLMRTPHGRFPEYHTSADNLAFIDPACLADSLARCASILQILESNRTYMNEHPKCEPQLGKRGLYRLVGGASETRSVEHAILWTLNLSDGKHTLLDIAERAQLQFADVRAAANLLMEHGLLREAVTS